MTRAPAMMGDFFGGGIPFSYVGLSGSLPVGSRRSKIAENGKALPMDRVVLDYNHYANTLSATPSLDVDQYTFGVEKTFLDGLWSAEIRMPFTSALSFGTASSLNGGQVGNLTLNLKASVYQTETTSTVVGLGLTFPTGSDTSLLDLGTTDFVIRNEAVHLMPFVGYLSTPDENFFYQFFAQADFAPNGNTLSNSTGIVVDHLNEAKFLYLDFQAGYWLYRDECRRFFPGVAAMLELHESSLLWAGDGVTLGPPATPAPQTLHSLLTVTVGLQLDVTELTTLRIGGAFPLTKNHAAFFDGEFLIQLNRYF